MNSTDLMAVDPSELVDGRDIKIDINMPKAERIKDFIRQMNGNPYLYRHGDRIVKISFSDTDLTFDEIYESILMNQ